MRSVPVEAIERIIDDLETKMRRLEQLRKNAISTDLRRAAEVERNAFKYCVNRLREVIE